MADGEAGVAMATVLVVEDERKLRELVRSYLECAAQAGPQSSNPEQVNDTNIGRIIGALRPIESELNRYLADPDAVRLAGALDTGIHYARGSALITQAGVYGFTHPLNARITVGFGATPQVTIGKALTFWFPRALAHEVNHSVRILAGPGFGPTLLPQIISEGLATAFDQAAFPGPANPWTHAITPAQECTLWKKAKPQLGYTDLYDPWMFGSAGIPNWTGFTIG